MKNTFQYISLILIIISPVLSCMGQGFKFALLTDLHVTKDTSAYNDLTRSIEQINNTKDLSFVLVTGDLTEEGDYISLSRVKKSLDKLNVKYYAVAGNHETKWSESGATDFAELFGSERFKFSYSGYTFLGFNTGPIIRMMDGHVAPQDIKWLENEFRSATKETPFILVTHYPLQSGDVDNWYQVTDIAKKYNVKVVLGGHYHRNKLLNYDGIPAILNRSNLKDKTDGVGGYSIYEITSDSILVYEHKIGKHPQRWGAYALNNPIQPVKKLDIQHFNDSINTLYPEVNYLWKKEIGNTIYTSPVVYKQHVYTADDSGQITCLSLKEGKSSWTFKASRRILGTPAVANNIIVFGSADTYIYGLNAETGKMIWKLKTNKAVLGAVTIDKNIAYIGSSDNIFRAIDINTGKIVWQFDEVKGYVETKPLIYENHVFFGAWDNTMYALNLNTGKLQWKWDGELTRMHFSPAAVWPVAAHGKLFFTAPDRVMTALDTNTGKEIWRTKQSMVRETIGLSEDNSRVYSKTMQDSVVCYSTLTDFPEKLWVTDVGYGYDHAPSMPIEKDGVVFGSTKNGILFALNAIDGKLIWKHKIGNSLINTLVPLNNTECVFTSADGFVGIISSRKINKE